MIFVALAAIACEPTPASEFTDRPVVSCFLEDGESPVLKVQKLIPFKEDVEFSAEDVDALNIVIKDETSGDEYLLQSIGGGEYKNEGLTVETGHTYSLAFEYDGEMVSSQTTVPSKPENVKFSSNSISVFGFPSSVSAAGVRAPGDGVEITWSNPSGDYYIVEGVTVSNNYINDPDEDEQEPARSFKLDYTQRESQTLSSGSFNYYGDYTISVLHIQPEYAMISQGSFNTVTTMVDIRGNIDGGYGIFTGIGRVSGTVRVRAQSMPF